MIAATRLNGFARLRGAPVLIPDAPRKPRPCSQKTISETVLPSTSAASPLFQTVTLVLPFTSWLAAVTTLAAPPPTLALEEIAWALGSVHANARARGAARRVVWS